MIWARDLEEHTSHVEGHENQYCDLIPGARNDEVIKQRIREKCDEITFDPAEKQALTDVIYTHQESFLSKNSKIDTKVEFEHSIDTGDSKPITSKQGSIPDMKQAILLDEIKNMLDVGVIQESNTVQPMVIKADLGQKNG